MTIEEEKIMEIEIDSLLKCVQEMSDKGYRLVQIGCGKFDDTFEINYSFDKDYMFENLRIKLTEGTKVPSISGVYSCSFIYENEIHDLYGIEITGINLDYNGNLIKTSIKAPFNVKSVTRVKKSEPKGGAN
ncbi:ech hydrogenase subunit D [Methanomicrobium sp. W14]|uniref:NADH-quinone oxidoreductase subunit C n=1 Tax=Methanomicrobium sp. W14 TaxID=2817839 RepID=UPI001AE76168|nr:NADH-quinone oxidoreductase subunit C [Methanomicrobium sp. W14]MBP2132698.1 ech hydrogenase subunit D [Methanomicrobium sp. W14]